MPACLFEQLCEEMDAEHQRLLSCTKLGGYLKVDHWLVFELRDPLQIYILKKRPLGQCAILINISKKHFVITDMPIGKN